MAKKKEKTQEDIDRQELLEYFTLVSHDEVNYPLYQKQLKDIMTKYPKYTYKGMKYCLWYITEHHNMPIRSIAIVPYYYNEAKKYYQWMRQIQRQLKIYNKAAAKEDVVVVKEVEDNVFE